MTPTVIAIIRWEDPASYLEWMSKKKSMRKKPGSVISVGLLLSEDGDNVRIALDSMDDGDQFHGIAVIPKRAIIGRIRKIPVPKGMLK